MSAKQGQKSSKPTEMSVRFTETFLETMDGRSATARELRDRLHALTRDLGGLAQLSYMEISLCRRLIHLERLVEQKETTLAAGRKVDENLYFNAINSLSGLLTKIGLKRRIKVLSLKDYLQEKKSDGPATPMKVHPVKEPEAS